MNTKCLIALSLFTFMTASTVQAADTVMFQPSTPNISSSSGLAPRIAPVTFSTPFSWSGFYFGGQIGHVSNKSRLNYAPETMSGKWALVNRDLAPKPSGFIGGFYVGSNIDLGSNLIISVDTDVVWSGRKDTQTDNGKKILDKLDTLNATFQEAGISILKPANQDETIPNADDIIVSSVTLKEKLGGALRARIGFASHRLMPYIAGGVAYTQMQYILSLLTKSHEDSTVFASGKVFDKTKTMIGYTIGGGFDLAMTDDIIMRTEYRYTDFFKKKFANDELKISDQAHNFRLGIAYKF
ncbi:outer membrane protein [Bartonella krasnovii]|uniref:Outer membrane beta-barrel protein n=1 Tax=Bartonella krasnovii TaxID=2267275 RepID=A0A5B9D324_9HYPH|nr:outer membrane beta-barrel protein [Bartonella krasnovii]QEE12757.1 porin family protein [Bartonella krasnovii]UNF28873.1 outer membrane beta-barrel protein [Bartonella krasnovii]UNF35239.1 outer membrane beta-barrel protein [Bartonella krasnovii]UNF36867.1 outer membrane beta-barrel protein [Bartonella krasnovii]UNF38553.1 outer membrane beta-barrel protein [Bartonella krasnovii]